MQTGWGRLANCTGRGCEDACPESWGGGDVRWELAHTRAGDHGAGQGKAPESGWREPAPGGRCGGAGGQRPCAEGSREIEAAGGHGTAAIPEVDGDPTLATGEREVAETFLFCFVSPGPSQSSPELLNLGILALNVCDYLVQARSRVASRLGGHCSLPRTRGPLILASHWARQAVPKSLRAGTCTWTWRSWRGSRGG